MNSEGGSSRHDPQETLIASVILWQVLQGSSHTEARLTENRSPFANGGISSILIGGYRANC